MATDAAPPFATVGAGRMGRGIAIAFAYAGCRISLVDLRVRSDEAWRRLHLDVLSEIKAILVSLVKLDAISDSYALLIMERIELVRAEDASHALRHVELVFEGVSETLEAKREVFDLLNVLCSDRAILASTTSSILVTELREFVRKPERFLNVHWLNPAYLIPVVELSHHDRTSPVTLERARQLLCSIGKVPVVCGATPGYIVPRLQALVMNEAARMIEEGVVTAEEIDKATRYGLGLRFAALGVVEFIDVGGCDILYHASRELSKSIDPERYRSPAILERMIADGKLGLKSESGFYDYRGRDLDAYRADVLGRTLSMSRCAGLWKAPAGHVQTKLPLAAPPRIRRAFADLPAGQVHYAYCGDANKPAVLFLHQTPRSWAEYREVLPLIGQRYLAIAMDTIGFGDSAPAPWTPSIERWAQVAFELLDTLGISRASVVGHHTGGVIAVEMAATRPERVDRLVLSSTPFTNEAFRLARAGRPPIDEVERTDGGEHLTALWQKRQGFYPQGRPDLLEAFVLDALKSSGDLEQGHRAVASYRMEDRIGELRLPVLVVCAPEDPFGAPHAAELLAHIPGARQLTVEGGMVPLPDQLPDAFAKAVLEFLDERV